ncbi:site-2 protease family protein [Azospirillum sp. B4]|uniref:site-2 protease family protein n=1 Tax=Azospirillum sp. B4 TaxID=95605 RepID=UPI00034BFB77|nr:site-2 protease family protein [Azospirillum sp. B4]
MLKLLALAFAFLKLGKAGGTIITMLVSLAVYAGLYGWWYAAGFIGLLFAHEMGHFVAARQRGLPVGAPTFIPFVGAWIELKEQPMNVETEAYVAAAGPFVGTVAASLVYFWGRETQSGLLLAIAYSGFFLNFFNLIPLSPLDGGRMTAILSPRIWFLGAPVMVAMMIYRPSPLLILVAIAAIPALIKAWRFDPKAPENQAYYAVPTSLKVEYGAFYLGLLAFLAVMTDAVHGMLAGA